MVSFLECFPLDNIAKLKCDHFYGGLSKWLKAMVAYMKASTNEKTYSNYLWPVREAEKEDAMEPLCNQMAENQTKAQGDEPSFLDERWKAPSPLRPLQDRCCTWKSMALTKKKVPRVMTPMEFRAWQRSLWCVWPRLWRKINRNEKHCYHHSSPEHSIHECPLVKASRTATHFNWKRGDGTGEGSLDPSHQDGQAKGIPGGDTQGVEHHKQTPFLNPNPFHQWYGMENIAKVRVNRESCMALLDNSAQINNITQDFIESHSLEVGPFQT